ATITLAAAAVEAWASSQTPEESPVDNEQREDEVAGRWVTVDTENIYVHPILKPAGSSSSSAHRNLDSTQFLIAVSGPAEAGWEALEETARAMVTRLAPIFAEYTEVPTEEPPTAPQRYSRG
ncbi:hypothetical protein FRC17_004646, partial [Serendipita sp. 399]